MEGLVHPRCSIREATRADVPAIAILVEEFSQYMRDLGDASELRLDAAALEHDGFGPNPAFGGLIAEVSGKVVGFLLHHAGYDTDAACRLLFVVDLFVTTPLRGRGIGLALMNGARNLAAGTGASQIVWTIDRRNYVAQQFYEGIGARNVEELQIMCLDI
jgi:GNAT superfamily N-acetyltransferase